MKDIKDLLQRYYEGETSLEEEAYLRQYLAEHPESADPASTALMTDLKDMIAPGRDQQPQKKRIRLAPVLWTAVAAAAVTALLWFRGMPSVEPAIPAHTVTAQLLADPSVQGEITDEELALEQARKALSYVSAQLNKGKQSIRHLDQLDQSVDKIQNESL